MKVFADNKIELAQRTESVFEGNIVGKKEKILDTSLFSVTCTPSLHIIRAGC